MAYAIYSDWKVTVYGKTLEGKAFALRVENGYLLCGSMLVDLHMYIANRQGHNS